MLGVQELTHSYLLAPQIFGCPMQPCMLPMPKDSPASAQERAALQLNSPLTQESDTFDKGQL